MKTLMANGMTGGFMADSLGAALLPDDFRQKYTAPPASDRQMQQALMELADLKRELSTTQQLMKATQRQIDLLAQTNVSLREELRQLARKLSEAHNSAYHNWMKRK